MSMSDVTTGTNSYYILQLLQLTVGGKYALFCKWGRTGTHIGSSKLTEYKSLDRATEAFECVSVFPSRRISQSLLCVLCVVSACVCVRVVCVCVDSDYAQVPLRRQDRQRVGRAS